MSMPNKGEDHTGPRVQQRKFSCECRIIIGALKDVIGVESLRCVSEEGFGLAVELTTPA